MDAAVVVPLLHSRKRLDRVFKPGDVLQIKVLGSGCKNCHALFENTKAAVAEQSLSADVLYVTDMAEIAAYGVMRMPALVIEDTVVSMGKVLRPEEVTSLLLRFIKMVYNHEPTHFFKECEKTKCRIYLCTQSCRSQIAEALGKHFASDTFCSYSAGTVKKDRINPDAVRLMKMLYGIDMEQSQYSKLLSDIPTPDIVILMGCNVSCPNLKASYMENWNLDDPTGKSDEEFQTIISKIEANILRLKQMIH